MVVHEPGPWFEDVLAAVAAQDYPNLRCLFLVSGEPGDLPTRIRAAVPGCFVRGVEGNPGFGAAANQVLSLVQGAHGLFCFLHDDVALEPSATAYRGSFGVSAGAAGEVGQLEVPIYAVDAVVRRSTALQQTALARGAQA